VPAACTASGYTRAWPARRALAGLAVAVAVAALLPVFLAFPSPAWSWVLCVVAVLAAAAVQAMMLWTTSAAQQPQEAGYGWIVNELSRPG
jgi:hypothetical protein